MVRYRGGGGGGRRGLLRSRINFTLSKTMKLWFKSSARLGFCSLLINYLRFQGDTVTPFKFADIKVRGFEILTYMVSDTNVVFAYTN